MEYLLLNPMVVPITMVRKGIEGEALTIDFFYVIYSFVFCLTSLLLGAIIFKRFESEVIKKI
jgi:ABC-type polysaccharide/polyol phosphate export permease